MQADLTKRAHARSSKISTQQLTQEAIALPLPERIVLARALWDSIHSSSDYPDLDEALYQELKVGAEAPLSEFVTFNVESIIQQAKQRRAAH